MVMERLILTDAILCEVQFIGASKVPGKLAIVSEFIEGGNVIVRESFSFHKYQILNA
jgi:hypothetical protein